MKREFLVKLIENRVVDTRKYRYYLTDTGHVLIVERIERSEIGTTAQLNREFVKEF